jgi:hypothetical protein
LRQIAQHHANGSRIAHNVRNVLCEGEECHKRWFLLTAFGKNKGCVV